MTASAPMTDDEPPTQERQGATMEAAVRRAYGTDALTTVTVEPVPVPVPGPGEVLVRVAAAAVDRGTCHIMAGRPYPMRPAGFGIRRPRQPVLGYDVAGVLEALGPDVEGFAVGDEVMGISRAALAEHAVAPVAKLVPKPASLSFVEAAALPISGLTALQAVRRHAEVHAGERVLIMGASGGVGTYAVQIAVADGAEVTGVASAAKLDLVRGLGAQHVIDHGTADPLDGSVRYDAIIDTGGHRHLRDLRRALTPKGRLVIVGSETDGAWVGGLDRQLRAMLWSPFVGQRMGTFVSSENAADLAELSAMADAGQVRPAIDRTWPLAEAAAAIDHVNQGRARGKVVVTVGA